MLKSKSDIIIQGIMHLPELMYQIVRGGKVHVKKQFWYSNVQSEMKSDKRD